jgi:hypothetical protein
MKSTIMASQVVAGFIIGERNITIDAHGSPGTFSALGHRHISFPVQKKNDLFFLF